MSQTVAPTAALATDNCTAALYTTSETPGYVAASDTASVELGVKFTVATTTTASAIRFYRPIVDATGYQVHLWDGDGNLLASGASAGGSATGTGWVQVSLSTPVSLTAETTYVASYQAKNGGYQYAANAYASARTSSLLTTPADAGVFMYYGSASAPQFPSQTYSHSAYFVTPILGDPDATAIPPVPPGVTESSDTNSVELGVKFTPAFATTATAVRFYRAVADSGGYDVHLWDASGNLLASGSSTSATGTGWFDIPLGSSISLTAGTTYVASYHATNGGWQYSSATFTVAHSATMLATPADAGVYAYYGGATSPQFPTSSYGHNGYFVTPVLTYTDTTVPAAPANVHASASVANVTVRWDQANDAQGSATAPAKQYDVYRGTTRLGSVGGDITSFVDADQAPGTYSYIVQAKDDCGNTSAASTAASATVDEQGLFGSNPVSAGTAGDTYPVTLGVKFQANQNGAVRGVQFYRAVAAGSSASVGLWDSSGTLLASATPASGASTGPGWVLVSFASPVRVTVNTTYTVGYYTALSQYSYTPQGLSSAVTSGDLTALASGGVFYYGTGMVLPSSSYNASSYWVSPVFAKDAEDRATVHAGDVVFQDALGAYYPNYRIAIRNSAGVITDLTPSSLPTGQPDVSPDGSRIAFSAYDTCVDDSHYKATALMVMNSDGSGRQWLTTPHCHANNAGQLSDTYPRWSPDGTEIAYVHTDDSGFGQYSSRIYKVHADGTGVTALTTTNQEYDPPTWSPTKTNGHYRIAFDSIPGYYNELYIMDEDGSNRHLLGGSDSASIGSSPRWSPDGNRIYFVGTGGTFGNFWYFSSSDGFATTSVTSHQISGATNPVASEYDLSADGSTIVYRGPDGGQLYGCNELFTLNISTKTATQVTHDPCNSNTDDPSYFTPTFVGASWPPVPPTVNYVALGDSVPAGEGTEYRWYWDASANSGKGKWIRSTTGEPTWETGYGNTSDVQACHRSGQSYPRIVAWLKGYNLRHFACTGSTAGNGVLRKRAEDATDWSPAWQANAAQLGIDETLYDPPNPEYNTPAPTKVSLTLGANDIHFPKFVEDCYNAGWFFGPDHSLAPPACNNSTNDSEVATLLADQKTNLEEVLTEIKIRGGSSPPHVYLTTYYDPLPDTYQSCSDITLPGFAGVFGAGITPDEMDWMKSKLRLLNQNIVDVAGESAFSGMVTVVRLDEYDDAQGVGHPDVMAGHKWCSDSPWVYGPSIVTDSAYQHNKSPFHPTQDGQNVIAQRIAAAFS